MKDKSKNKYVYGWTFYQNFGYGHGWEKVNYEDDREMMRINKKAYRDNDPYPLKVTYGRALNENRQV